MPLFFVVAMLVSGMVLLYHQANGSFDKQVSRRTVAKDGSEFMRNYSRAPIIGLKKYTDVHQNTDLVEAVLLRTCRVLNILAQKDNCDNVDDEATMWGFAGTIGATGKLLPAWEGSTVTTFSCDDIDEYGRHLIQSAIPVEFIREHDFSYNFTAVEDAYGKHDPCGYDQLIGK